IIEGLQLSSIKTAEGVEVGEGTSFINIVQSDADQLASARDKASGKPETNTFIMNDETYSAYALGALGGRIKLALPNINKRDDAPVKVTDSFYELQRADAFSKQNKSEVLLKIDLKEAELRSGDAPAQTPAGQAPASPSAVEVRR